MSLSIANGTDSRKIETNLVAQFISRVQSNPSSIVALRQGSAQSETLTLAELGLCAERLADALVTPAGVHKVAPTGAHNVKPEGAHNVKPAGARAVVGVFAYPGFELLSGLWGALLSGNAYCPLSPDYPEDRLRFMIENAGMTTIICEAGLESRLRAVAGDAVTIITPQITHTTDAPALPFCVPADDDLAYVIFTSGSTGRPKGVMIEHRNIASQMSWFHTQFDLGEQTRILQKTPFSFDAAQWELLASAFGAVLVFGSPEGYRNPFEQIHLIQTCGVTMLQCVPTLWRALLETERLGECTSLRSLFSGGEALSRELARDCLKALPEADLVNLYGPTECTINASSFRVTQAWIDAGLTTAPIGWAARGTDIVLRDENGARPTNGTTGEIWIGGCQVGRGYLNNPSATAERFVVPQGNAQGNAQARFYRTGDIGRQNPDGSIQFLSRMDGQIKLRGYRIEIEEIRNAIENHDWVKAAGVFVAQNSFTQSDALVACVELSPNQAQLMDASTAGDHHRSKSSKLQVKAQMSGLGLRQPPELEGTVRLDLPGKAARPCQSARAFSRKSYRHFEGPGRITAQDIQNLLRDASFTTSVDRQTPVGRDELGEILRNFGQFPSAERLLPKYAYASPGALYATQIYISVSQHPDMADGLYYYHPVAHALYLVAPGAGSGAGADAPGLRLHFIGKSRAISHVYKLNIREVLDFEVGHILGLFDQVLPPFGLAVGAPCDDAGIAHRVGAAPDDFYLGGFAITGERDGAWAGPKVSSYVQPHAERVTGLPDGLHAFDENGATCVSPQIIAQNHVIAINQQVYARSAFGIGLCVEGSEDSLAYVALGRALQRLQLNDHGFGFMSSGYSSRSGEDQRAASRFFDIVGDRRGAFYFGVGGRVSAQQIDHRGMNEDMVHSKGPLELIKEDLRTQLPEYMVPNHIVLVDAIPLSANGKLDMPAVRALVDADALSAHRDVVAPRNLMEQEVARHWVKVTGVETVSVTESFFALGGDSLGAVKLVMMLNEAFCIDLPLEAIFEADTIEGLAKSIADTGASAAGRLVPLAPGTGAPIFCWPGLGGYPMGLRDLAGHVATVGRPVFGVQAYGLNAAQVPDISVPAMAARDVVEIRSKQPHGPYTLLGYSFGARVAVETARQLEAAGETVDNLVLVAPGSPVLRHGHTQVGTRRASFENPDYVAVLISVLTRKMGGPELVKCLSTVRTREDFVAFAKDLAQDIPKAVVERIAQVAITSLDATYVARPIGNVILEAPVTVIKASGDEVSFVETGPAISRWPPHICELPCDHFRLLMPDGVDMLRRHIVSLLNLQAQLRTAA
jgi:amino acid adenylation domain-containing protein